MDTKQRIINEGQHILTKEDKEALINTGEVPVKYDINPNDFYTAKEIDDLLAKQDLAVTFNWKIKNGDKIKGSEVIKILNQ